MLDFLRALLGAALLLYAVRSDLLTRRVPNRTWLVPVAAGLLLDVPDGLTGGAPFLLDAALSAGFMVPVALLVYYSRGFGGADAKALIALSVLVPRWPVLGPFPLGGVPSVPPLDVFAFAAFSNALIAGLAAPVALLARNLRRGNRGRYAWLGYPAEVARLDPVRMKLLGDPTGALGPRFGGRELTPDLLDHLWSRLGADAKVWVTPKLPFMVPLAAGFGTALVLGNLLLMVVSVSRGL